MSDESYASARPGALKLKGASVATKKAKKSKKRKSSPVAAAGEEEEVTVHRGTGRLSSSGTTVRGYETTFLRELRPGDAVIVSHPTSLVDETKLVTMVLSDVSIAVSSAFSTDLVSTCAFRFVQAPREQETDERKQQRLTALADDREDTALGDYAGRGGSTLVYQERKKGQIGGGNGWITVKRTLGERKSRTELLEMRSKFKSDRHCG
mmetsp:Transcript_32210/g.102660  ORF Transcript_32210/g.102660 Transcript_32210/m.102660 type:complete len:208 (-) Transcript_32210:721-1344(-)